MCGRYVIASRVEIIEKRFRVKRNFDDFRPNYNVSPGELAPIITDDNPTSLQLAEFGFTPSWSKKKTYVFNARAEGDRNKENDPGYTGPMGIKDKPFFRNAIRYKRCLVIADAFIEGTTKERLSKPYLVYLRNKDRPFAFAGLWSEWTDKETGEITKNFAIITTTANELLAKIPHHRSPCILPMNHFGNWIRNYGDDALSHVLPYIKQPYPASLMNAYPISAEIKRPRNNDPSLLEPAGARLEKEYELIHKKKTQLEGMGFSPARGKRNRTKAEEAQIQKQQLLNDKLLNEFEAERRYFEGLEANDDLED